jgi:TolB-like protein
MLAGAGIVALVAVVAAVAILGRPQGTSTRPAGVESMAVLPFRTAADAEQEFLGVGLAEALVARLARSTPVMIPSMATTRLYTAAGKDARQVGREMGVNAVLEGQVQRSGDRLRASLRLVRVTDGRVLWSDTYDERLENLFGLQDAIAERVGAAVSGRLATAPTDAREPEGTADVKAYELYLRGQYARERRDTEGYATAKSFFDEALAVDPRFVAAHVAKAEVLLAEGWMGWRPVAESEAAAEKILRHALSLDNGLAAAHGALAQLRLHQWRWAEVKSGLERAMSLAPQQGRWYDQYAVQYCLPLRQFEEALRLLRRAQVLDPLSRSIGAHTAAALFYMGRLDAAIAEHRQVLVL